MAGTAMVFLRFAECNLRCTVKNAGFDCDTEFVSSRELNISEIIRQVSLYKAQSEWVLLTGGEPALQVTGELISALKKEGFKLAIETNGTIALPDGLDWITVSPKSAEHTIRQRAANEVRYVRGHGTALPESIVRAEHYFISPVFQPDGSLLREDFDWCVDLIKSSRGRWRLSMQSHKLLGIR